MELVISAVAAALLLYSGARGAVPQDYNYPVLWNPGTIVTSDINYADGPAKLKGYLAYQNTSGASPRPTVIIYPDWDGISNYERWRAHLLANLGYTAFVADVFSTAVVQGPALPVANRSALLTTFRQNTTMWRQRLLAAVSTVRTLPVVDTNKIFAIGYCFGGGGVLELFRAWPNSGAGLLGVCGFHAPLSTTGTKAKPGNPLRVAVYNGADDPGIQPESAHAFKAEVEAANATWQYTAFGRTVHAFTLMENPLWNGSEFMSNAYNPVADRASWWGLRGLLLEQFGYTNMTDPYTAVGDTYDYDTGISGRAANNTSM